MKLTLESTDKIVDVAGARGVVKARAWEGKTAKGVPVVALIALVGVRYNEDASELAAELLERHVESTLDRYAAFPARLLVDEEDL